MDMKELVRQFEEIMSATAFAEAGELDTAREILNEKHKVLLVLTGMESDMKAARYALNLCKRIGAGLEILYITNDISKRASLDVYLKELETKGIEYQIAERENSLEEDVKRFADEVKGVQFVVVDSQDLGIASERDEKKMLEEWERLKCPLVLVSGLART